MRKTKQIDTRKQRGYHKTPQRKAAVAEYNRSPRGRYQAHKLNARTRGIGFEITFDDWWMIWEDYWHLRGRGVGRYHMCRYGDIGSYTATNVYLATHTQNVADKRRGVGKQGWQLPESEIERIVTLRSAGVMIKDIASLVGCSRGTVSRYLKEVRL